MARLADGDRAAFRPVFDLVWPEVRRLAERFMGSGADAEDAAQVALLKLFERACDFDRERDALSWMLGIVAYECLTLRRTTTRRREVRNDARLAEAPTPESTPEEQTMALEMEAALAHVMATLAPADQSTLRAAAWEGERAAVKPATFRKRLARALTRLRAAWRNHGAE